MKTLKFIVRDFKNGVGVEAVIEKGGEVVEHDNHVFKTYEPMIRWFDEWTDMLSEDKEYGDSERTIREDS